MEETLKNPKPQIPWFIRSFNGENIILERDFIAITGVDIRKYKLYSVGNFTGYERNGWGWKCNNEEFKAKYGFDYGDDDYMAYFYPCGVIKALKILKADPKVKIKANAERILINGLKTLNNVKTYIKPKEIKSVIKRDSYKEPIQINILFENEEKAILRI